MSGSTSSLRRITLQIVLTGLLSFISAGSTAAPADLNNYFKEVWTTRDGLPHNTVNAIQQSDDGYLWIGTWEGAARFNGRAFTLFGRGEPTGMPDVGVRTMNMDRQRNLILAGARGGLSQRTENGWHSWPPLQVLINAVSQDPDGNLWLATEGQGLYRQSPTGERLQLTTAEGLPSNVVSSVLADNEGAIWVGTGRGLVRLNTNANDFAPQLISSLPAVPVLSFTHYQDSLLIGTERGLYQLKNDKVSIYSEALQKLPVSALLAFDDQMWIGTTDRGLFRLSERGLESLDMAAGLPNNRILSLFRDREGSIWVGTNGGLFRLRDAPFVTLTSEQGLAGNYIRSVLAHSDGSIWVGSSRGISRITPQGTERVDISAYSDGQSVLSLVEAPDGSVWIGTYSDGVLQWQNNKIVRQYNRTNGLLANEVRAIAVAPDGGLWVGTAYGLNFVDQHGITSYTTQDGLPTPFVMGLYLHHDGRLFIGTGGGVAIRQPDGEIQALDISYLDDAEYAFGFAPDPVADRLWMSTDRGLVAFDLNNGTLAMLGREAGLPFDKVFQAVIDNERNLWLSSNRGILYFERAQIEDYFAGRRPQVNYQLFGESDGMQSAQANGGSMQAGTLAQDGSVWFATSKGASRVKPSELSRFSASIPPVVIEGFKVNGLSHVLTTHEQLPPEANRIEIQFAGLGFIMPERIQYRTRLKGFDSEWVNRGANTLAEYTNLPPGDYQFAVQAAYPGGDWSEQNAQVQFTINPHLWQQTRFWFALLLSMIALIFIMHRLRLKNLRIRAAELSSQVAKKTYELKQQADHLRAIDQERSALLQELKQQAHEFELQARSDKLTGLANRRAFDEALIRECARARRQDVPLCVALLDIDHFKLINDNHNHSIGDKVLKQLAEEVSQHCREEDLLARWGGEEFVLLLPNCNEEAAHVICERIRIAIDESDYTSVAADITLSISIGITCYQDSDSLEQFVTRADEALYLAKQNGRNQVRLAS
ncbi:ligand-binding sensor domain-containing diguanylate cyclase [Alteromonas lipolytica]|uniref:diguanylate cyclase n=1 Tax=Alteromonas lipolytica TaxID=1856405 RepID=A0A1E8F9X5_9ALTE|nr:ligand-binding sensor domain-containing diguanylate cyclase [Alteromonas lipolytica]OFI32717.1 ABC transporter substrate-binding protein [Alteromonas lipolytica]GGF73780.1 GGDEF domain-containing protein [Alteromonas lipolytica]